MLKSFIKKTNWTKRDIQIGCPIKRKLETLKKAWVKRFVYLIDNIRRPNPLVRRDLLKVDPPTAAEALARAEEDDRTHGGRPFGTTRPKAKPKA